MNLSDEMYNMNLARQIADIVEVEPSAYECLDMEHIVDCVNSIRDILAQEAEHPLQERPEPQLDYIQCHVRWSHFTDSDICKIEGIHDVMKHIIEN